MVYCPEPAELSAVIGQTVTLWGVGRDACSYSKTNGGQVSFAFVGGSMEDLVRLRTSAIDEGSTVVDVPALGSGAFSYDGTEDVNLRWTGGQPASSIFYLSVPLAHKDVVVNVATLFTSAIGDPPAPTVPAKDFTLVCPSAKQVSRVVGRTVVLKRNEQLPCMFKDGDNSIFFGTARGYGKVSDYRARVLRDATVSGAPPGFFQDVSGLNPGAFTYSDLTPPLLSWQLEPGVVAQVSASEQVDVLRRLAVLFATVQKDGTPAKPVKPGTPAKPGLPSTGN